MEDLCTSICAHQHCCNLCRSWKFQCTCRHGDGPADHSFFISRRYIELPLLGETFNAVVHIVTVPQVVLLSANRKSSDYTSFHCWWNFSTDQNVGQQYPCTRAVLYLSYSDFRFVCFCFFPCVYWRQVLIKLNKDMIFSALKQFLETKC